jgi:DNA polymerase-3 subunit gamma/tau
VQKLAESYIPLYRKYRPQKFSDLVGQETVVKTLSNAINFDKVAHAYLFTGSRGTGKTSTARILAKSLNCVEGPTTEPCGKCPSCIDIANSNSIDVIEIDAASNRNVEDARNLIDKVHFMPVAGKYKIYIIDEVHMLTPAAFNTLLKTLEEPPKNLVFILATTESHKVLTTIISRCQRFDFKRVNQDLISQRLKEIAQKESIKINDKAVSVISRRCHGGMRDALGLLDQISVLSSVTDEITESDIITLLGSMPEDTLYKIADSLAARDTGTLISLIDEISATNEPVQVVRELINYFRNMLFIKTSKDLESVKDIVDLSENIINMVKEQTSKFEIDEIVQIIEKLSACERNLKTSSQQLLWLEVGLIGICHRQDIQTIKELESRIAKLEEALSGGAMPSVRPAPVAPPKPIEIAKPVEVPKITEEPKSIEVPKPEPVAVSTQVEESSTCHPEQSREPVVLIDNQNSRGESIQQTMSAQKDGQMLNQVQHDNKEEESTSAAPVSSGNLAESWKSLLEAMDSVPARSFFIGLSQPVEVNSEKIVIVFKSEAFIKQAKDSGKITPLEKAAEKLFGKLPRIVVRTALPTDAEVQKKNEVEPPKPKVQQISSAIVEEAKPLPKPTVVVDEAPVSDIDKEVVDELDEVKTEIIPVNLSEQAKLILNLFNGKVIET